MYTRAEQTSILCFLKVYAIFQNFLYRKRIPHMNHQRLKLDIFQTQRLRLFLLSFALLLRCCSLQYFRTEAGAFPPRGLPGLRLRLVMVFHQQKN